MSDKESNFLCDLWEAIWIFFDMQCIFDTSEYEQNLIEENKQKRLLQYDDVHIEARELFSKKNSDYGDAFASYGPIGVLVRMGDKTKRLSSIEKNKIINVNDETLRDTLIDLHNYSAMAIMLMDEE
jgi:hypothetical protein